MCYIIFRKGTTEGFNPIAAAKLGKLLKLIITEDLKTPIYYSQY